MGVTVLHLYILQGVPQRSLAKAGITLLVVKMHRKTVSVLGCLNVCDFKHAHSLNLGSASMAAKSVSENLESVEIKAAPLTCICPF